MVNGIIANSEVLEEEYIPQNIPCREVQKILVPGRNLSKQAIIKAIIGRDVLDK